MPSSLRSFAVLAAAVSLTGGCGSKEGAPAAQETAAAAPARYDAEAFFTTTSYALAPGYAWSSDDKQLLVNSNETGIFNLYALSKSGEGKQALTSSTVDSNFSVSWFPADARVLFTADQGGNDIDHLYVRELSGATRDLTPGDKAKAEFGGWSHDGQYFYVLTTERDPKASDLYRYTTKHYARTLVFRNDDALAISAVSPDGRYVALLEPRTIADSNVYLLDIKAAKPNPQLITKHEGNVTHDAYGFTRDSKQLVYSTDEHGEFTQAWTYDIASGKKSPLRKRKEIAAAPAGLGCRLRGLLRLGALSRVWRQRRRPNRRSDSRQGDGEGNHVAWSPARRSCADSLLAE